ncbi:MAG TPA: hypothetical protein VF411_00590 [Bacteroidia bacterium]
MKHFIILVAFISISISCFGQGVEVVTSITTSPNILYQGAKGIGINYQFLQIDSAIFKKPIQFGVAFQQISNTKTYGVMGSDYEPVFPPTSNTITYIPVYYFTQYSAKVKRTSYRFNALIVLRNSKYFLWAIGPEFSYNVFTEHRNWQTYTADSGKAMIVSPSYSYNGSSQTFGIGLLSKVEIRNIFTPHLSLTFNVRPELISNYPPSNQGCGCRLTFWSFMPHFNFHRYLEFQLGLKYNFSYSKKKAAK